MWVNNVGADYPESHRAFASLDSVWALSGEVVTRSGLCTVERIVLDGMTYYVKKYRQSGEGLASLAPVGKARREWSNLLSFKSWGLPAAELAAYGEAPYWHYPRRAVLITQAVDDSVDLAQLYNTAAPQLRDAAWVSAVSSQVARATRVMHQHSFAHNDWKWRNILVRPGRSGPDVFMIDCPSGMTWWGPLFEYRRIKDLACLDKIAVQTLSRSQRLRFYRDYVQRAKLTQEDKRVIRKIVTFFKGRE